jgi:hypothetical protein
MFSSKIKEDSSVCKSIPPEASNLVFLALPIPLRKPVLYKMCDPRSVVIFEDFKEQTDVMKESENPIWNAKFTYRVEKVPPFYSRETNIIDRSGIKIGDHHLQLEKPVRAQRTCEGLIHAQRNHREKGSELSPWSRLMA